MSVSVRLWSLTLNGRVLRCELRSHARGRVLVLLEDDDLLRGEVMRSHADVQERQAQWLQAAKAEGWAEEPTPDLADDAGPEERGS